MAKNSDKTPKVEETAAVEEVAGEEVQAASDDIAEIVVDSSTIVTRRHGVVIVSRPTPPPPPKVPLGEGQLPPKDEEADDKDPGDGWDHEVYEPHPDDVEKEVPVEEQRPGRKLGEFDRLSLAIQFARKLRGETTADWYKG